MSTDTSGGLTLVSRLNGAVWGHLVGDAVLRESQLSDALARALDLGVSGLVCSFKLVVVRLREHRLARERQCLGDIAFG